MNARLPIMLFSRPLTSFTVLAFAILFFSSPTKAVELTHAPEIKVSETTATITWSTDVATGTRLTYGTNARLLTRRAEGELGTDHVLQLKDLQPGTVYYYSFGTARVQLGNGSFTTTGAPQTNAPTAATTPATQPRKPLLERLFPTLTTKPATPPQPALAKAPPASATWAHLDSLQDHFDRHGRDFSAKSPDDYAAQAWQFLQRAKREGLPAKWDDADQSLRVFDPKTRAFASYDRRGKTRTYFKPSNPNYWQGQPGRTVSVASLGF